jgi:hypothetical protein
VKQPAGYFFLVVFLVVFLVAFLAAFLAAMCVTSFHVCKCKGEKKRRQRFFCVLLEILIGLEGDVSSSGRRPESGVWVGEDFFRAIPDRRAMAGITLIFLHHFHFEFPRMRLRAFRGSAVNRLL